VGNTQHFEVVLSENSIFSPSQSLPNQSSGAYGDSKMKYLSAFALALHWLLLEHFDIPSSQ
jgi:hypothetical protein